MPEMQAGITALITAYARVYHAARDEPKIFDDTLACQLFTDQEMAEFDRSLAGMVQLIDPVFAATQPDPADALARVMQIQNGPITLSRSRYTEDCLEAAIRQGIGQYVILGAGMDTYAFRCAGQAQPVEIFEVDHPATQALKRERIKMAGWRMPPNLHFVPLDFNKESLADGLARSAYNASKRSFFSWLGVTFYLTREVVLHTLREIASLAPCESSVVFDYLDEDAFDPDKAAARVQRMQWITRQVGEPMKTGFDPDRLAGDLASLGLCLVENLGPEEINHRYFSGRNDGYRAFEHVHFAKVDKGDTHG